MNKDKLIRGFIIGTFVSLYLLVSIISTIHVIDFFELSNPRWMAITLAIGFEIGAAASLASLIIMKKMNKTLVWSLFIAITAMQINGNLYYAFINMQEYNNWVELFNLLEWEPLAQKRLLAIVSGAILPLIALGFIKSLVDYIKPKEDKDSLDSDEQELDKIVSDSNSTAEKKTEIVSESIENHSDLNFTKNDVEFMLNANKNATQHNEDLQQTADDFKDLDVTLNDGLDDLEEESVESVQSVVKEKKLTSIANQVNQPETRVTDNHETFKKGPLWKYRTNHNNDDKVD